MTGRLTDNTIESLREAADPTNLISRETQEATQEELDEAEFYIQQGLADEARKIYQRVLKIDPGNKIAMARVQKLASSEKTKSESKSLPDVLLEQTPFFGDEKEPELEGFDLAHELEGELGSEMSTEETFSECPSFDDLFTEFKKGVEREVRLDDYQAHYDLGIAYREMGLFDDAIGELMTAKLDPEKEADCFNLIGLCYIKKGNMDNAIKSFITGLKSPQISVEGAMELSYELAVAYEMIGKKEEALRVFGRIKSNDSDYRDVEQRIFEIEHEPKQIQKIKEDARLQVIEEASALLKSQQYKRAIEKLNFPIAKDIAEKLTPDEKTMAIRKEKLLLLGKAYAGLSSQLLAKANATDMFKEDGLEEMVKTGLMLEEERRPGKQRLKMASAGIYLLVSQYLFNELDKIDPSYRKKC